MTQSTPNSEPALTSPNVPKGSGDSSPTEPSAVPVTAQSGEWIIPELVYRGSRPPKSTEWTRDDWAEQPHYPYIPVSHARFAHALLDTPEAQATGKPFHDFLDLLGLLYHVHYYKILRELKEDYEYFSASTGPDARKGVAHEELLQREYRFLSNFLRAMVRGNFQPLRESEYQESLRHNFLFDLPVELHWEAYDERLFDNFHSTGTPGQKDLCSELGLPGNIDEYLQTPEAFRGRIWTFFRGGGREHLEGLFLPGKIDLWLTNAVRWIIWPFQWVVERLRGDEVQHATQTFDALRELAFGKQEKQVEEAEEEDDRSHIFETRWVRHLNLHNQPIPVKDILEPKVMQEPTFHRMISLYRLHPPAPQPWLERLPIVGPFLAKQNADKPRDVDWTIFIKLFREIPMADSEMIYPARKLRMKSSDVTVLVMTGAAGLYALYRGLQQNSSFLLFVLLGILGMYVVKLVLGYRRVKQRYQALVTHTLYHKNLDNDMGVLEFLVSSMEEQDLKEAALVYFVLWSSRRAMTADEIDKAVETFLHEKFEGLEVDFEVGDALRKVVGNGDNSSLYNIPIVQPLQGADGALWYQAIPLENAIQIMDERWDNLYEAQPDHSIGHNVPTTEPG